MTLLRRDRKWRSHSSRGNLVTQWQLHSSHKTLLLVLVFLLVTGHSRLVTSHVSVVNTHTHFVTGHIFLFTGHIGYRPRPHGYRSRLFSYKQMFFGYRPCLSLDTDHGHLGTGHIVLSYRQRLFGCRPCLIGRRQLSTRDHGHWVNCGHIFLSQDFVHYRPRSLS